MRALHVAAGNLFGGVERMLVEIGRGRGAWQHEVALAFDGPLAAELDAGGVTRHALAPARFSRPLSVWRARRALAAVCRRAPYDIVICHSPWSYALGAPAAGHVPRILWAHDALQGRHWTERLVYRATPDLVIANSHYTARAVKGWLASVPIEVVHAPLAPTEPTAGARAALRDAYGATADTFVVLIASRLERWKGHTPLLEAVARLTGDWRLWVAGAPQRGHEARYFDELTRHADALGIGGRVLWLGARQDVRDLLEASDVLCQPNTAPEPFGIALVEALQAARPVVTSEGGGASEIVDAGCGVLTPPGDVTALAAALQRLADDRGRRTSLGANGPARAAALCDPAAQLARLDAVLSGLVFVVA